MNPSASLPFEPVDCYLCGSNARTPFLTAQDDLSGRPGEFSFVTCTRCGLKYQHPRVARDRIAGLYDEEYIAHRKRSHFGPLTRLYEWAMDKHDRDKAALVGRYVSLGTASQVLDVGCAVGTFLQKLKQLHGCRVTGVDFKDLSAHPALGGVEFHCGSFPEVELEPERFDLVTMWHFLEHAYEPMRALETARSTLKRDGRLIIEVPRLDSATFALYGNRWPGLQAPQHTVLFEHRTLRTFVERAGFEVVDHLAYGAFPAYFYLFAGAAFTVLGGRGLHHYLSRAMPAYFLGQLALSPLLIFEKKLNLAMQTVVCRKR